MAQYLKKEIERMIMKENEDFEKEMKFVVEKNRKKVPKGATYGEYGRWVKKWANIQNVWQKPIKI